MLRNLKSQRARLHRRITTEIATGKQLVEKGVPDSKSTEETLSRIDVSVSILSEFQTRFEELSNKIGQGTEDSSDNEIEKEGEFVTDTVVDVSSILCQLSALQRRLTGTTDGTGTLSGASSNMTALQEKIDRLIELETLKSSFAETPPPVQFDSHSTHAARLPKLELQKFSGDILQFKEFWDSFEAAIDSNPRLHPVEKLNYLRVYLTGEAKHVISGISTSEANYDVAVELIKRRFGKPQASIDAHYNHLTNISSVPNQTSKLRNLADQLENHFRCLSALGEDVEHRHFVSLIMSKLPREVIVHLEETKEEDEPWTVKLLRRKLQGQISAREAADRQVRTSPRHTFQSFNSKLSDFPDAPGVSHNFARSWNNNNFQGHSTTESLVTSDNTTGFTVSPARCILCGGSHYNDECPRFKSVEERRHRLKGRCFICLKDDHQAHQCQSSKPCFYCEEYKKHNRCLCPVKFPRSSEASAVTVENLAKQLSDNAKLQSPSDSYQQHSVLASGDRVLLQTATVQVSSSNPGNTVTTRALLDCGSNRTYMSSVLADKLSLQSTRSESFSVVTFGCDKPKTVNSRGAQVKLYLKNGSVKILDVNIVTKITGTIHRAPIQFDVSSFLWNSLPLADSLPIESEVSPVDLLIGNDYYLDLVTAEKVEIGNGLYLLGSQLGWLLTGRVEDQKKSDYDVSLFVRTVVNNSVSELCSFPLMDSNVPLKPSFEDFWNLESIGIVDKPEVNDDDRALASFNSSIQYHDGRYQATWPWKDGYPDLPDNYQLSLGRFQSLVRKLKSDPTLLNGYAEILQDQEAKGIIEKVSQSSQEGPYKHYIPHHAVVTPTKVTTKIRIVYDASAKVRKGAKSLNECLYRGPVMIADLTGLLLRFRTYPIAIVSDIEKAFLQIALQKEERDVTRFFWLKNPKVCSTDGNLQIYRFCRVPFGIICSPFLLAATLKYHLNQMDSVTSKKICENLYVDNVITGTESIEDAKDFYQEAKSIFQKASMNLREWASNSSDFTHGLSDCDQVKSSMIKVLGVSWKTKEDVLHINTASCETLLGPTTKREMLRALASVFDPLGLFVPLTVRAKAFIRKLWSETLAWDDIVSQTVQDEWRLIAEQLAKIPQRKVPRVIGRPQNKLDLPQLFCFCDASAIAYSTAVYFMYPMSQPTLVFSKSRLAPARSTSIPRLELLAVIIGVRCLKFVSDQLRFPIAKKVLWTDSQCVLHWLSSKKPLTVFVDNRIREIKRHTDVSFRYVPTRQNPADIATRGLYSYDEMNASIWWTGPDWLSAKSEDQWPVWPYDIQANHVTTEELHFTSVKETTLTALPSCSSSPPFSIDINRFSSLIKLYRVTAWVQRFIKGVQGKRCPNETLSSSEVMEAKICWEIHIQKQYFSEVLHAIDSSHKCNIKEQLNLKKDNLGILRCHGRFAEAELPDSQKFPKLLPKNSYYTDLVVRHFHGKLLHSGIGHTLSQIRHEYWIPQGRSLVRGIVSRCITCRRQDGGPYRAPLMPPWPASRVSRSSPFSYTGLDYFGPLLVRNHSEIQKVWVCLFTCMTVRAVHLEMVNDMSAKEFLLCFRRFVARRGKPIQIISDNAAQFKLSKYFLDRLWGDVISDPEVHTYVSSEAISWKFIVERAPWIGGFYERLIGSVKRALKKGIGKICLTSTQLHTVLTEVEAIVNSRPLLHLSDDSQQGANITPGDFLSLNPKPGIPLLEASTSDDPEFVLHPNSVDDLLLTWQKGHRLLDQFWRAWRDEYLVSLRERRDFSHKQSHILSHLLPSIGDVVLIKDDNQPRGSWKVSRIISLIQSQDGEVRAAKVMIPTGIVLNRPLQLLYPLECNAPVKDNSKDNIPPETSDNNDVDFDIMPKRELPKRKAALEARDRIKGWINESP